MREIRKEYKSLKVLKEEFGLDHTNIKNEQAIKEAGLEAKPEINLVI